MSKEDKYFIDWENDVFGYGYGTGEQYTLKALKDFLAQCSGGSSGNSYDFQELEKSLGATVAWLMINILAHADIIEYGTSPRFGWLTSSKGTWLKDYIAAKSLDELYELTNPDTTEYIHCLRDYCNCDDEKCGNPLFVR